MCSLQQDTKLLTGSNWLVYPKHYLAEEVNVKPGLREKKVMNGCGQEESVWHL